MEKKIQLGTEAVAGVGISLTAGVVSWVLRAGTLGTSFLTTMPVWRSVDPMPLLSEDGNSSKSAPADDVEVPEDLEQEQALDELLGRPL